MSLALFTKPQSRLPVPGPAGYVSVAGVPVRHVLSIDPGDKDSAWMLYNAGDRRPVMFAKVPNAELLSSIRQAHRREGYPFGNQPGHLAIEMIASYGMPVGREVFETCLWIGRFIEAWGDKFSLVYRKSVKLHLCGSMRAKDPNIRAELINRFGPGKERAIGKKATPGPLYGVAADIWSALAVAVTWSEGGAS